MDRLHTHIWFCSFVLKYEVQVVVAKTMKAQSETKTETDIHK